MQHGIHVRIRLSFRRVIVETIAHAPYVRKRDALRACGPVHPPPRKPRDLPRRFRRCVQRHIDFQHVHVIRRIVLHQPHSKFAREVRRRAEIHVRRIAQVQVARCLLRNRHRRNAEARGFQRRAYRAGNRHTVAAVLAVINPRNHQRGQPVRQFNHAMLYRLRWRAIHRINSVNFAPDQALFFVNAPFARNRHTAPGAALLFARGNHQHVANVVECFHRRPQTGGGNAVVVGEKNQGSFVVLVFVDVVFVHNVIIIAKQGEFKLFTMNVNPGA